MSDPHLIPHWDIYENIPLPCLIIRPDFSIAAVNHAYLVKNHCTRSDLLEQNFFELLHANTTTADLIRASFNYVFETHSSNDCGDHDNRDDRDDDGSSQAGICCVDVHG